MNNAAIDQIRAMARNRLIPDDDDKICELASEAVKGVRIPRFKHGLQDALVGFMGTASWDDSERAAAEVEAWLDTIADYTRPAN